MSEKLRSAARLTRLTRVALGFSILVSSCYLFVSSVVGISAASASGVITITALGTQGYGALFPTLSYSYGSLPAGVTLSGNLSCTTVNVGTPINSSLATGSYTIDGSTCSGVSSSDPSYTISYVGGSGGFNVGSPSAAPSFNIIEGGFNQSGGIPFTFSAGFTLSNTAGPEPDAVTVTIETGAITPEMTILSAPTPADTHWNCLGTNIATQTVSCVYTPSAGSPLAPGTSLSFDVNAVMAYDSSVPGDCSSPPTPPCNTYTTIIYVGATSADTPQVGETLMNVNVFPQSPAPSLSGSAYSTSIVGGTTSTLTLATVVTGNATEPEPVTVTVTPDSLYTGLVFVDVPAQSDPNWNCSASDMITQVVSCTYTPPVGSPLPAGTILSVNVDVTAPVASAAYFVGGDVGATSADTADAASDWPSRLLTLVHVLPPADTTPPAISNLSTSPSMTTVGHGTTLTATASDSEANGTDIASAQYSINGGPWTAMSAGDGTFDSTTENLTATIPATTSPVAETICVRATDAAGNTSDGTACTSFVVYDPSAGFVTGGGWITSPAGACQNLALCTDAQGKGTFGFVSKYPKGATVPSGNAQYVFHDGNLNFASSSYQWLVVNQAGINAQFKGTGTINGTGSYQFMIWATAGSPSTFRIQVTDPVSGITVYDTGTQPLGGGSILIHKS